MLKRKGEIIMLIRTSDFEEKKANQEDAFQAALSIARDEKDMAEAVRQWEECQDAEAKQRIAKERAQEGSSNV